MDFLIHSKSYWSYNLTYSTSNPLTGCSDSKTQSIVVNDTPVLSVVSTMFQLA